MARTLFILLGLGAWLVALAIGGTYALQYQRTPGRSAEPEADWPEASAYSPAAGRYTLVLFAHPHCPCTRVTFEELAWLLGKAGEGVEPVVFFVVPRGAPADWEHTALWREAESSLPGKVHFDRAGGEAGLFGARTSGQVLVFDPRGRLAYCGGITDGRGHRGDNPGRREVLRLLTTGEISLTTNPVYGCPLLDDEVASRKGQQR